MGTCIICTKNFENGRTECPECGFSTKLPKFLSAEQYTEWSNETVVPYRKDYLMKKKVREIERFKKAEQLSREVSQEIAAEKVKNIVEDTVNATVSKQLLVLQKESLKGLKERVQKLLQDFEAKQDWKADVPKEYVFFYTEGMPLSKEEVSLKTDRAKTAEQWETLKQRIQSQAEKTDISLKPEKQQEIEGNVSKTFEESLSSNVAARNLLEIKKIAEEVLEKNGDKEEIRQKALEVFKMISESDLADFKEKITISLDKLLKESMDQEEEALFKEMEADAKM